MNVDVIQTITTEMQVSLKRAFAIVASWPLAFAVSQLLPVHGSRDVQRSESAVADAAPDVEMVANAARMIDNVECVNRTTMITSGVWAYLDPKTHDSWGNPIQATAAGAYSLGVDGVSASKGNDRDDINSWDTHHRNFYSRLASRQQLIRTFWLTPLILGGMLVVLNFRRVTTSLPG